MSSLPNFPDSTTDFPTWAANFNASQPSARTYNDYYGDILTQHGFDPNHVPQQGDANYLGFQHSDPLFRQQANSALAAQQRHGSDSFLTPGKGVSNDQATFLQSVFEGYDLPRIQGAADAQYGRVNTAIDAFGQSVGAGATDIRNAGQTASSMLMDQSKHVGDQPMQFAMAGVQSAQEAVRQAQLNGNDAVQAGVAATNKNLQLMRSSTNPDGSPMTAEQVAATSKQVIYDSQIASGQIRAQYDNQTNQLRSALAGTQEQAGGVATNVAQLSSSLAAQSASVSMAATQAAAQFEALGMQDVAKMISANPQSIVSVSNGLLNMWGVFLGGNPAPRPDNTGAILGGMGSMVGGIAAIAAVA